MKKAAFFSEKLEMAEGAHKIWKRPNTPPVPLEPTSPLGNAVKLSEICDDPFCRKGSKGSEGSHGPQMR